MIDKFTTLVSTAVPLPIENIDTDQIIPARFLKATTREGFGNKLFYDWKFDREGKPKPDFVLNSGKYRGEVLVTGKNFGCGSSREHAAWALKGAGFKAIVSSHFADIFRNNAFNNGLLPVEVGEDFVAKLLFALASSPATLLTIDLERQEIRFGSRTEYFQIPAYKKECLLKGYDDIDYLLYMRKKIEKYESNPKMLF